MYVTYVWVHTQSRLYKSARSIFAKIFYTRYWMAFLKESVHEENLSVLGTDH